MSDHIFDYCDSCGGPIREETLLDQDRADQAKKALSKPFKISVPLDDYTALTEERNRLHRELAEAREWIATHPPRFGGDYACRQCYPHGYSLVDGFVCQYHKALAAKERKP